MKKYYVWFMGMILSSMSYGFAAGDPLQGKGDFKVDMDIASFYGDSTQSFVEMYYGFPEKMLTYVSDSGRSGGRIIFSWTVKSDTAAIASKRWSVSHVLDSPERLEKSQTLLGIQSVGLPPGNYRSVLCSVDANDSTRTDSVVALFRVPRYPVDKEYFSDIELCTSIQTSDDKQSMFYKNTLEVIPNPSRLYGSGLPILDYYTTAYNLLVAGTHANLIVRTDVLDAAGNEILTKEKNKPRLYNASVEIGTVNLSATKTGSYVFRISLLDTLKNVLAVATKRFFVYKIGSLPDSTGPAMNADFTSSKYVLLNAEDIDRLFAQARYVATSNEKTQYRGLTDLNAKRKCLYEFWHRRDADMVTPFNETEDQYYQRVESANQQFTSGFQKGWETDRGRVLIIYGTPDEVERFQSTTESNPYEIWHYHSMQGGVVFVFVDRDGMGNHILVHSTYRDELRDEDWYNHYALKMK